jgi:hypothetical protein
MHDQGRFMQWLHWAEGRANLKESYSCLAEAAGSFHQQLHTGQTLLIILTDQCATGGRTDSQYGENHFICVATT